jgi:hypothetical protein
MKTQIGLGLALGAGIGAAVGVASGQVGLWLSIGIAIGVLIGSRMDETRAPNAPACIRRINRKVRTRSHLCHYWNESQL